jgi:hypothetical protein
MADERKPAAIDFYTFVLSLASSAFVHLGDAPHPETGEPVEPNFAIAQQTIEILAMLREKTRGNLTPEEEKFMENLLTDLRLRFVQRSAGKAE